MRWSDLTKIGERVTSEKYRVWINYYYWFSPIKQFYSETILCDVTFGRGCGMFIRNGNWSTNQGRVETKSGVHFRLNETPNAHTPYEFSGGVVVVLTEIRFHLNSFLLPQTPRWASHFGRHTLGGPAKRATTTSGITREWRMPVLSLVPFDSFGSCLGSSVRSFVHELR